MTTKMIGVKEFRQNMAGISEEALRKNQRLIILKKNQPIFELKPLPKEDAVLEKLVLDVQVGLEDMKNKRVYSHEEMKSLFGLA
jgi:hypothetical protein